MRVEASSREITCRFKKTSYSVTRKFLFNIPIENTISMNLIQNNWYCFKESFNKLSTVTNASDVSHIHYCLKEGNRFPYCDFLST
jgi:hypothetical protein